MTRWIIGAGVAVLVTLAVVQGTAYAFRAAERYVYEEALPRVVATVQKAATEAVQNGVRNGANGVLRDATGGLFGGVAPSTNPCAVPRKEPAFTLPWAR